MSGHWLYKRSYISKSRPALTVCRPRPSQLLREPYRRHRLLPSQSSSRRERVSAGKMRAALWSRHRPAAAAKAKVQVTSHVCMETSLFAARKDKRRTKGEAAFAASAAGEYLQASPCNLKSVTMRQAEREHAPVPRATQTTDMSPNTSNVARQCTRSTVQLQRGLNNSLPRGPNHPHDQCSNHTNQGTSSQHALWQA